MIQIKQSDVRCIEDPATATVLDVLDVYLHACHCCKTHQECGAHNHIRRKGKHMV